MRSDDLADLLVPEVAKPPGGAAAVFHRQGILLEWDPLTWENKVYVDGETFANLPVLGVAEAESYAAGDVVSIISAKSSRGAATWGLIGQFVQPGTAKVTAVLSRLSGKVKAADVVTSQSTSSTTWADLSTAGPSVTVNVGVSGRLLVIESAGISWSDVAGTFIAAGGAIGLALSGANTASATDLENDIFGQSYREHTAATQVDGFESRTITAQTVLDGLNPGATTAIMKYRCLINPPDVSFNRRVLTAFAL